MICLKCIYFRFSQCGAFDLNLSLQGECMSARKFGVRFLGVSAVLLASLQAEGVDKKIGRAHV